MAYMRGRYYLWSDATHLHLWVADGHDDWDQSGWAAGIADVPKATRPSGVCVPIEVIDELVVMRLAQMIDEDLVNGAIQRALFQHRGNGGCVVLAAHADRLRTALGRLGANGSRQDT